MMLSYRTRRVLKGILWTVLALALAVAVLLLCGFIWTRRYVVYTRDRGAVLDFSVAPLIQEGQPAKQPEPMETVPVVYLEDEALEKDDFALRQLRGYYVDREAWVAGVDQVREQALALEPGTPLMLEMKSALGNFFYSSAVAEHRDSKVDAAQVDALIAELRDTDLYLIARVPAFRDRMYGLNNVDDGIFDTRGAYLYRDDGACYWLDPTKEGVVSYLMQIVNELKSMGFDEVVFDHFGFPDTEYMRFKGDKEQALRDAALTFTTSCMTNEFAVSFVQTPGFPLPDGRTRLYLTDAAAADAASLVQQTGIAETDVRVVFLTQVHDTRFDEYSVLRPLDAAH